MDDLSSPPARSAVSTFFMRLGQRYQSLLGKSKKKRFLDKIFLKIDNDSKSSKHYYCLNMILSHSLCMIVIEKENCMGYKTHCGRKILKFPQLKIY